jgi:hypothetical protein
VQKIGVAIGLDTSDLVANAERAKNALESLRRAAHASIKTGNIEDLKTYAPLYLESRRQVIQDARIGGYYDKIAPDSGGTKERRPAPEPRKQIEQDAAIGDYSETAPDSGGTKERRPAPEPRKQIEQDAAIGGYSETAPDSGGTKERRPAPEPRETQSNSGDLQELIESLDAAMQQKIAEGKSKEAEAYASVLEDFRNQLSAELIDSKNHTFENTIRQAINSGDINAVHSQLDMRKQYIQDARIGGNSEIKLDSGPLETVIRELKDAINRSISEGKTEEAKKYGSILKDFQKQVDFEQGGDEQRKKIKESQQLRLMRNLSRFTNAQNVIGSAGAGNVAGAALGVAGGIGDLIASLPKGALIGGAVIGGLTALAAGANKLSEQWEKMMQPSMGLAASLGRLTDDAGKNHAVFQEVFAQATDRRVLHGYKMEEGIALASQLSKSGMESDNVIGGEEQVFRYQRFTDADRGSLAQAVGYAGRYRNNENVLGYAFGGAKESGMQQGQYQEYLNATLRIFEGGLSRGVVKGFAEITRTQNMLAMIGDTWKGEQGAEKYERMNSAVTGAYNLQSDYDVILYNAARNLNGGKGDYIETAKTLDQGLTPDLLGEYHKILEGSITGGDDKSGIMQYMKTFNLNATAAEEIYNFAKEGKWKEATEKIEEPDSRAVDETPEGRLLSVTEGIRSDIAKIGSNILDSKAGIVNAISLLTGAMAGNKIFESYAKNNAGTLESLGLSGEEKNRVNRLFGQAYSKDNQPDLDNNLKGDWGENAGKMQDMYANLPIGAKYQIANNSRLQKTLFSNIKRVEDFLRSTLKCNT